MKFLCSGMKIVKRKKLCLISYTFFIVTEVFCSSVKLHLILTNLFKINEVLLSIYFLIQSAGCKVKLRLLSYWIGHSIKTLYYWSLVSCS